MTKENFNFSRPSDSFFTHLFARSISRHLTPIIAKTSITPLQVTIIGLIIGLYAAYTGSNPDWAYGILAAFLIELSHILDCVDGELARLTGRGSPFAASLDPISDRMKDMAIIYAACIQSIHMEVFNLSEFNIFSITFLTIGLWFLYMYIVDAYLNPARKKIQLEKITSKTKIYLGLYDLFIYGSIIFCLLNLFEYFIFYVLFIATIGVPHQIVQLKKVAVKD